MVVSERVWRSGFSPEMFRGDRPSMPMREESMVETPLHLSYLLTCNSQEEKQSVSQDISFPSFPATSSSYRKRGGDVSLYSRKGEKSW